MSNSFSENKSANAPSDGVSRRTIVKGAAWSVPVIAAAVAVPVAVASDSGVITFEKPKYTVAPGGTVTVNGTVTPAAGSAMPATVTISYTDGFSGPATVQVDPTTGAFVVPVQTTATAATSGTLTASAANFTDGTTVLEVILNPVPVPVDGIVWGENNSNTLFVSGSGTRTNAVIPDFLTSSAALGAKEILVLAGGYRGANSYLIRSDNTLWSHGDGSNATAPGTSAINAGQFDFSGKLLADEKFVDVVGFTGGGYVLTSAGRVFSWGFNTSTGSLGNGKTGDTKVPNLVTFPSGTFIVAISASYTGGIALDSTGKVWAWGQNDAADTGTGGKGKVMIPKNVLDAAGAPISGITQIRGRMKGGLALTADGKVLSWGAAAGGRNGNGDTSNDSDHAQFVLTGAGAVLSNVVLLPKFYHEAYHSVALTADGTIYSWGYGSYYTHTPDNQTNLSYATPYAGNLPTGAGSIKDISLSYYATHVLYSNGEIYSWGNNSYSAAADGTSGGFTKQPTRAMVDASTPVVAGGLFANGHGGKFASK